ncbi:BLUF domain-containing protein [Bosea sp. (in: a-proteobacteria)]|uniref:BLUF domain-containing protein n=1 Tax=Bosea sp. (in: a-proteobacteria) TaxID=1871050 RepID=UPI002733A73C|nr:BLUF domain-containing protein [Bosea sp. (in: a-proteobacteria)]MDP3407925.1 BLUF domain-containing protein [Bosea sp. (in: a-proteobacteria)]
MGLMRLVYASESRLVEANRHLEIDRIVESARRLNAGNDITGFLLATTGAFAQVLEGDDGAVFETYTRIAADPRHGAIQLLAKAPIDRRRFPRWSMGLAERDETTSFIFGLYGVTPEADLPRQEADVLVDLSEELARQRA